LNLIYNSEIKSSQKTMETLWLEIQKS
jgi:hypothetical protein